MKPPKLRKGLRMSKETSNQFDYHFGQRVFFDNGMCKGQGKIVGCSTIGVAVIGRSYMVEVLDGSLPNDAYPFNTVAVFECHLLKDKEANCETPET